MTAIGTPLRQFGTAAAIEQGTAFGWTYSDGERRVERWQGPAVQVYTKYTQLKSVAAYSPEFDAMSFDAGRGVGRLELSRVEDGEPLYELFPNETRVPVWAVDYFTVTTALSTALTYDEIMEVRDAFYVRGRVDVDPTWNAKQQELFKLLALGTEETLKTTYVLRESRRVSKRSTVAAVHTNVDRVEAPPSTTAVNALIGQLPDGEWLRRGSVVRQIAARRWEIVTEWWLATKWSAVLYGGTAVP